MNQIPLVQTDKQFEPDTTGSTTLIWWFRKIHTRKFAKKMYRFSISNEKYAYSGKNYELILQERKEKSI